jgi:hypothetical protein
VTSKRRLDRIARQLPPPPPPVSLLPVDLEERRERMRPLYSRLEAQGLVFWDEAKGYWSPVDVRLLRELLRERRGDPWA